MNNEIEQKMVQFLEDEPSLRIFWTEPPQVMLMPFMRSKKEFFASVCLVLIPSALNLETLGFIVTKVAAILSASGLLEGLQGTEVRLFIRAGKDAARVMRLSAGNDELEKVRTLAPPDLLKQNPIDGVTCTWYVFPPTE